MNRSYLQNMHSERGDITFNLITNVKRLIGPWFQPFFFNVLQNFQHTFFWNFFFVNLLEIGQNFWSVPFGLFIQLNLNCTIFSFKSCWSAIGMIRSKQQKRYSGSNAKKLVLRMYDTFLGRLSQNNNNNNENNLNFL